MKFPKRKSIRLARELYQGPITGMATICFYERLNVIKSQFAGHITYQIDFLSNNLNINILIYCLMPDHLHLILNIENENRNFLDLISYFKRKIAYEVKKKIELKQLWQDRFVDRIIRNEKELDKMVRYILDNPVRRNLVNDFRNWPYSGERYFELWKNL